ncbi:MAG: endonuclease/exonuclease/phosphatase family protein, partial [Symploca sp. SIO2B6]|nr:endonuclease/exonuclease/phosphatase family protein [Symploca sp. SIO2B6]
EDGEDDELNVNIDRFSRTVLQLSIQHENDNRLPAIQVFAAHLKSKQPTIVQAQSEALKPHTLAIGAAISTIRRTAEAAALRVLLTKQMKHTDDPVVVLGDLNDGPLSNTLSIISQQPPFRMYQASRVGRQNDVGLYTVSLMKQMRAARDVVFSHEFNGIQEVIDHVLVSEQFYDHSKQRIWSFKDLSVWNDHVMDDVKYTSDHGVVCAYFLYDPNP